MKSWMGGLRSGGESYSLSLTAPLACECCNCRLVMLSYNQYWQLKWLSEKRCVLHAMSLLSRLQTEPYQ